MIWEEDKINPVDKTLYSLGLIKNKTYDIFKMLSTFNVKLWTYKQSFCITYNDTQIATNTFCGSLNRASAIQECQWRYYVWLLILNAVMM